MEGNIQSHHTVCNSKNLEIRKIFHSSKNECTIATCTNIDKCQKQTSSRRIHVIIFIWNSKNMKNYIYCLWLNQYVVFFFKKRKTTINRKFKIRENIANPGTVHVSVCYDPLNRIMMYTVKKQGMFQLKWFKKIEI